MFVGSRFCAHCGAEATRSSLQDDTPLPCPRCNESLQPLLLGATTVRECAACGGLWVDPQTLQHLCDEREAHAAVVSALAARIPTNAGSQETVRYVPCPRCKKLMNRVNFSKSSGVILDVCKADGVWLDRGEMQRVVGFVEAGGLTIARERQRERLVEEQRRLTALEARGAPVATELSVGAVGSWRNRPSPNASLEQLLADALGIFVRH